MKETGFLFQGPDLLLEQLVVECRGQRQNVSPEGIKLPDIG